MTASVRILSVLIVVAVGGLIPTAGSAQSLTGITARPAVDRSGRTPVDVDSVEAPAVVTRLSEEFQVRLRAVEQRFQNDPQLQRAGAIVALGATAFGALRGQHAFTFVGTHALLLGLAQPLARRRKIEFRDR